MKQLQRSRHHALHITIDLHQTKLSAIPHIALTSGEYCSTSSMEKESDFAITKEQLDLDDLDLDSVAETCFSGFQDSNSSQSSIEDLEVTRSAVDDVSLLFHNDEVLAPLLQRIFRSKNIKQSQQVLYDILLVYCTDIEKGAGDSVELEGALFVRRKLLQIINSISKPFPPGYSAIEEEEFKTLRHQSDPLHYRQVEKTLTSFRRDCGSVDDYLEVIQDSTEIPEMEGDQRDAGATVLNLDRLKRFLVCGQPWKNLRSNFLAVARPENSGDLFRDSTLNMGKTEGSFEIESRNSPKLSIRHRTNAPLARHDASNSSECSSILEESGTEDGSAYDSEEVLYKELVGDMLSETILDSVSQGTLDRFMEEFWILFDQNWASNHRECTADSHGSPSTPFEDQNPSNASSSQASSHKRQRDNDPGQPPRDDGDERRRRQKSGSMTTRDMKGGKSFACPFRKCDPRKYNILRYSGCAKGCFYNISRVKYRISIFSHNSQLTRHREHLKRRHKGPIHCQRCGEEFLTKEDHDAHVQVPSSRVCELVLGHKHEGISSDTMTLLISRKKAYKGQPDEEIWKDIYRLLFPGVNEIPSPRKLI